MITRKKGRGRPKINGEATMARFPKGTLKQIEKSLSGKETLADFLRAAVAKELAIRGIAD